MITPEQRKKLVLILKKEYPNASYESNIFFCGAEALARIQFEDLLSLNNKNVLCSKDNKSDEEAATDYATGTQGFNLVVDPIEKRAFLAGCARYRPIVEEMLEWVYRYNDLCDEDSQVRDTISRAEKLLGKKDE